MTKNVYLKISFSVLLITLITNALYSQNKIYTLDNAIKTALAKNRDVSIANMNIEKASATVREAYGNALPSLDIGFGFNHFLQQPSFVFDPSFLMPRDSSGNKPKSEPMVVKVGGVNTYEAKAQLTQIIFNNTVLKGISASGIYLDMAKEQYKSITSKTITDVKKAFFAAIYAKNSLEIAKTGFETANKNYENVKLLHEEGFVSDFDLLQAEVFVVNMKPIIAQSEMGLKAALDGLKLVLGIPQSDTIDIDGELTYSDEIDLTKDNEFIEMAYKDNFDLKTLDYKKQVDEAMISLYTSEFWPTLIGFANYTYNGQALKGFDFAEYATSIVGISFSMNLFNGLKTNNRVQQAEITYQQTEEQFKTVKDAIAMQVKIKLNELKSISEIIAAQEKNVEKAERAYDIATIRFQEGEGSQLEIQNMDMALRLAKNNRLQSYYNYNVAKAELNYLTGNIAKEYFK